jgi:hypothetical protein
MEALENCYMTETTHRKNTSKKTWGGGTNKNEKKINNFTFSNSATGFFCPCMAMAVPSPGP